MNINAKITMLFNDSGLSIELHDSDAAVMFCKIEMNQEQALQALSRLSYTTVESCQVANTEILGKKMESQMFDFEIPERSKTAAIAAVDMALRNAEMTDWQPDNYYSSQGSFFTKDGKQYARVTIRRWV